MELIDTIKNLTPKQLKEVQSVLALFSLMGITDEQLAKLPIILSNWGKMADNLNKMAVDLIDARKRIAELESKVAGNQDKTKKDGSSIASMVGLGKPSIDFIR